MSEIENNSPDVVDLITGDLDQGGLNDLLPTCNYMYEQVVKCHTRGETTIDLCYCNIKASYKSIKKPQVHCT